MSTGVQDQGKNQQSQGNAPKESRGGAVVEPEEQYDAWRTLPTHAAPSFGAMPSADPYMPGYYGNAAAYPPYPTFGVGDGGAWSNGGDHMAFMGGYGHQPDSYGMEAGMFGGGQGFGGFGQPGYGYGGFPGTGDYSAAWGTGAMGRKYDEYYRDASMYGTAAAGMAADEQRGIKQMEQGMQGLSMDAKCTDEGCDGGLPGGDGPLQKKSWASIASQPAKPNSSSSKTMSPLAGGRDAIGMWDGKTSAGGLGPKPVIPPTMGRPGGWSTPRGRAGMPPSHPPPPQGYMPQPVSVQQPLPSLPPPPPSHPVLDDLRDRNEYNPREFDCNQKNARFFVIKSYSEDDIHRSIKYEVWCSTDHGNKRLDSAFRERDGKGPVYLLFSVNGSGHFCGMAQMVTAVDYSSSVSVWAQDKWKGQFKVRWVYVKDVPNAQLRHIRLENNENKPVTNSRDTQEVLPDKGRLVLKIMHSYNHRTSIFDDFVHYEQRQEEEESRRPCDHITQVKEEEEVRGTGERGRGRGRRN